MFNSNAIFSILKYWYISEYGHPAICENSSSFNSVMAVVDARLKSSVNNSKKAVANPQSKKHSTILTHSNLLQVYF